MTSITIDLESLPEHELKWVVDCCCKKRGKKHLRNNC